MQAGAPLDATQRTSVTEPEGSAAAAAGAPPAGGTAEERLAELLINNQSFRCSVLWGLHTTVPADVCARFLLSAQALNEPLQQLVAAASQEKTVPQQLA